MKLYIQFLCKSSIPTNGRRGYHIRAKPHDVRHKGQGHSTRANRQKIPSRKGPALSIARQKPTRQARHRASKIQDGSVCAWMLLASAYELQICRKTEYKT